MLFFLYGPDTFRSRQKLNEIMKHYKEVHKNGLNLQVFDCLTADFQDFRNEIETISMFKEKKLIVLKDAFLNPQFEKSILDYKENLLRDREDIILFFEGGEVPQSRFAGVPAARGGLGVDKKKPLFQFLEKNAKSQEFQTLAGQKLKGWAQKEIEKYGFKIKPEVLEKLIFSCRSDLWQLSNEIQKLIAFKLQSGSKIIGDKDSEILTGPEIEADIFKTIDAMANKNKKEAIILLHRHLEKGEPPLQLLAMISYQFRNLLAVKNLLDKGVQYHLLSKKVNLHPFVIKKCYEFCKKFTSPELKKIYHKIFEVDLDIKTGKVEAETALDLLIAGI